MRTQFKNNLTILYKQYAQMLKSGRMDLAKASAAAYNEELYRIGGPKNNKGEWYLSLGGNI